MTTASIPSLPPGWEVKTQTRKHPRPVTEYHIFQDKHLVTSLSFAVTADMTRVAIHILTTIKKQL